MTVPVHSCFFCLEMSPCCRWAGWSQKGMTVSLEGLRWLTLNKGTLALSCGELCDNTHFQSSPYSDEIQANFSVCSYQTLLILGSILLSVYISRILQISIRLVELFLLRNVCFLISAESPQVAGQSVFHMSFGLRILLQLLDSGCTR